MSPLGDNEVEKAVEPIEEPTINDEGDEEDAEQNKSKSEEKNAMKNLDSVVVEEKTLDENKMKKALDALREKEVASLEAEKQREKELAAICIKKEDVTLLAQEFELVAAVAERKLREAGGNVVTCIQGLLNEKVRSAIEIF